MSQRTLPPPRFRPPSLRGFTFVEMVIAVVLLGILATVGVGILYEPYATANRVNIGNADSAKARYALERIARELREVKHISTGYCFTSMGSSSTTFHQPLPQTDGVTDVLSCATESTNVTVGLSGTTLQVTQSGITTNLADNVSSFSLGYLPAANTSTVTAVTISLTITNQDGGQRHTQSTSVELRN